jgi:hypothetical protein
VNDGRVWKEVLTIPAFVWRNISQDSQSPGRYLKPAPPEYEAGVLTTQPRYPAVGTTLMFTDISSHIDDVKMLKVGSLIAYVCIHVTILFPACPSHSN